MNTKKPIVYKKDINNVIFYQLNENEKKAALSYCAVLEYSGFSGNTFFAASESDLLANAGIHSLIVSNLSIRGRLGNLLFHHGIANYSSFDEFIKNGLNFLTEGSNVDRSAEIVLLAFLPLNIENMLHSIFSRFGYQVQIAHSIAALEKKLQRKSCCVIIDSDISYFQSKIKQKREVLFKNLYQKVKQNPLMSVVVLKNFSQGSLFEDLNSSIRYLSEILLSPEEFINFILRFFPVYYDDYYYSLLQKNITGEQQIKRKMFFNQKDTGSNFKNLKNLFSYINNDLRKLEEQYTTHYQKMIEKTRNCLSSFQWIKRYLLYAEAKNNRESFSFVSGSPSVLDKFPSSNKSRNEEFFQKKKESPQSTRILFSSE